VTKHDSNNIGRLAQAVAQLLDIVSKLNERVMILESAERARAEAAAASPQLDLDTLFDPTEDEAKEDA
jgi:hypothetical protein